METNGKSVHQTCKEMISQVSYRDFIEFSAEPCALFNQLGQILLLNKRNRQLCGLPDDMSALVGKKYSECDIPWSQAAEEYEEMHHAMYTNPDNETILFIASHVFPFDKKLHSFLSTITPLYDKDGGVIGTVFKGLPFADTSFKGYYKEQSIPHIAHFSPPEDKFNVGELETIFFALHTDNLEELAKKRGLLPETVISSLKLMYKKANVDSFDAFIDYCKKNRYEQYIPLHLYHPLMMNVPYLN